MELSVTFPHTGRLATPEFMREFATTAEDLGFGALFGMDHMVMPVHTDSQYTLGKKPADIQDNAVAALLAPNFEMHTSLTYVAGVTSKIKLATGVAVLPIRNTVMNARQLATLDVLSGGRVLYGVGVGWLKEEAEAMNMPWDRRGARTEESIAVMRTLWCAESDVVEFHGEFNDLPPMHPDPRPIQRPDPDPGRRPQRHRVARAPDASATAGSRRRCRRIGSPSTGARSRPRRRRPGATPRRSCWSRCRRVAGRTTATSCRSSAPTRRSASTSSTWMPAATRPRHVTRRAAPPGRARGPALRLSASAADAARATNSRWTSDIPSRSKMPCDPAAIASGDFGGRCSISRTSSSGRSATAWKST